jgi:hypothetical protein
LLSGVSPAKVPVNSSASAVMDEVYWGSAHLLNTAASAASSNMTVLPR